MSAKIAANVVSVATFVSILAISIPIVPNAVLASSSLVFNSLEALTEAISVPSPI